MLRNAIRRIFGLLSTTMVMVLSLGPVPAFAGGGTLDENDDLNLNFHFRFPPLQSDIDRVQSQLQRASEMLCDATEGQMKIATARLTAGGAAEPAGDIWYYPPGAITRSRADGPPFTGSANRIYLSHTGIRAGTIVHELGHLVFGLGDQYDEQRRMGTACGIGPSFDADGLIDEANHSIMQPSRQVCVTPSGENTSRTCYEDSDCETGETCPLPSLMSEFSVPANNDLLRGDDALAADTCPTNRPGDTFRVSGFLGENNALTFFDATDLDTAKDTARPEIAREYIDEIGDVPAYNEGSAHPVWVFAEHVGAQAWTLHFGIDEVHLSGGTEGDLQILGSIDVEFEATPSKTVSSPGDPDYQHRELIAVNGVSLSNPAYTPPTITIPAFENGASQVVLAIEFDELDERQSWSGGSFRGSNILAGLDQQLGVCGDTPACEGRWNTGTQRWEATDATSRALQNGGTPTSDWERIVAVMASQYERMWTAPAGLPSVDPDGADDCDAAIDFDVEVEGIDQVYLVLDRSWSMDEERTWTGTTRSRLDWAKAGARGFADLMVDEGVDVGLISFNNNVTHNLDLEILSADGAGIPGAHEITPFKDEIDGLNPANNTAIGDALDLARTEFAADGSGQTQAVMLLSDGEENGGTLDPSAVADALRDDGVYVYAVPLGTDSDGELLSAIADTTGGEVYNADSPDDLPPIYAQMWGKMKGEAPIWANVASETEEILDNLTFTSHIIPVEVGSQRLNVMLSGRGTATWDPTCILYSPSGAGLACDDPAVAVEDEFYKILRVPNPEPGNWTLAVYGQNQPPQRSYIWAHSDNPDIECSAGTSSGYLATEPGGGTMITATASNGAPLGRDTAYLVQVTTPNGTVLPVEQMDLKERLTGAEHLFTQFQGRGRYEVLVTCLATEDSKFAPGEQADVMDVLDEGSPVAFLRQARTSFYLAGGGYPPPPPGDDCDGNGVTDTSEPNGFDDTDGDGVQNYCDTDDDGDDVPDADDRCPDEIETWGISRDERDPIDGCAVVPEPGFSLALAFGGVTLGVIGRRRRTRGGLGQER